MSIYISFIFLVNLCTGPEGGVPCNGGGAQAPRGTPGPANPAITSRINPPQKELSTKQKCGQSYLYMSDLAHTNTRNIKFL